jgi:tight adherence protein C
MTFEIFFYAAAAFTVFCTIALLFAPMLLRPSPEAQRILEVVTSKRPDQRQIRGKERFQESLLEMARNLRRRLALRDSPALRARLIGAGHREANGADIFFTWQLIMPLVGAFAGHFIPVNPTYWTFAFAAVGYLVPDMWLTQRISARKMRIRRGLPDAIDLMVICVDAGLGLDQALIRVCEELAVSYPDIHEEFTQINLEQRAGKQRLDAWQSFAERVDLPEITSFVSMMVQSDRFGTPIIRALSRFSEDLRLKRRQHAEEAAAKTKIKIIFPLVVCIFPCIFIVLLAPAMISISVGMKAMGH